MGVTAPKSQTGGEEGRRITGEKENNKHPSCVERVDKKEGIKVGRVEL